MFQAATTTSSLSALDIHCMESALKQLDTSRFISSHSHLFLNACPETLMNPKLSLDHVNSLLEDLGILCERIVLEVTEENVISNYDLFRHLLEKLRTRGFKIAIDDFGCGYAGLKMLSTIEPDFLDFLKIEGHCISNIDRALVRFNLVQAISTACHRIGVRVIVEGIERTEELAIMRDMGIEFLQGFLLGRPSPQIDGFVTALLRPKSAQLTAIPLSATQTFIGDFLTRVEPVNPSDPIITVFRRLMSTKNLSAPPVVKGDAVVGMLNRSRFLEGQIIGTTGYGYSLNSTRRISEVMESEFIPFESSCTLQEASKQIQSKPTTSPNESFVVLKNGRYQGLLSVSLLLDALTEENISLARDSNPLSGPPGNNIVQREITRRLAQNMHF